MDEVIRLAGISSPLVRHQSIMAASDARAHAATTAVDTSSPKLRQRSRVLAAQNDSVHPRIDNILASKEHDKPPNGIDAPSKPEPQPGAKAVSTARPTSPLMPIVRSLERLGESLPKISEIKMPASNIEVK